MGDRYELQLACDNCKKMNDAYYAPSCGYFSFTCEKCKKVNWIKQIFKTEIITKKEEKIRQQKEGFA